MRVLLLLICLIALVAGVPGLAAADNAGNPLSELEFEHLTYTEGLFNVSISAITQDQYGFLWFASQSGLHRYDGYAMEVFTAEPFKPNSLSNQLVQTVYLSDDGVLWAGTYGGLNRVDLETENFQAFEHSSLDERSLSNNVVVAIAEDADATLWVGTLKGLNRLDVAADGQFTRFTPANSGLPHETVRALHRDSQGRMWAGTYGGLSRIESRSDGSVEFINYAANPQDPAGGPPADFVMAIREDSAGHIWLGTWGGGLTRFDPQTERFSHVALPDQRVYSLLITRNQTVYAGTWGGGLHILEPDSGRIYSYRHDPSRSFSLAHDVVYSLFEDRGGVIWIGTNGNGISKLDPERRSFRYLHRELPEERRLSSGKVQALYVHPGDGTLIVGLQNSGINVVDPRTGAVTRHRHNPDNPNSISSDTINMIFGESDSTVLIATHTGINRLHLAEGRFERVYHSSDSSAGITDAIVYQIARAPDGTMWFGTYSSGVFRRSPDGRFHHYPHDPQGPRSLTDNLVYNIIIDRDGVVWIATNGGLNRYRPETDDFDRFTYDPGNRRGLSGRNTGNLLQDSAGTLWVGTRSGGLNRFDAATETFSHLTARDGLPGNAVVALAELEPGILYVATAAGLARVDTATMTVTTVDERDGLYVRDFSTGVARAADGSLLFGAFSEVIRVRPRSPAEGREPPLVAITGVRIYDETYLADRRLHALDRIELGHRQNFISFTFATMDFTVPARNAYRYRLTGIDADWRSAATENRVSYTNLPPGRYRFEVMGADAFGVWSERPATLDLVITPPFWRTAWFLGLASLVLLYALVTIYIWRVRSIQRRTRELEHVVAERTAELREANGIKDRFFSILAHDLRSPIAGLAGLTEGIGSGALQVTDSELREIFDTVRVTAQGLQGMLENLFEWARLQTGTAQFLPDILHLRGIVTPIAAAYSGAARAKGITVTYEGDAAAYGDEHMTRVIVENLLNNALKFTPTGGAVQITCAVDPDDPGRALVMVRDSGVGIAADRLSELFRVDNRVRTVGTAGERGNGFGLALCRELAHRQGGDLEVVSSVGHGTTVTLRLPRR